MNIGIIGAGNIAGVMAKTINQMEHVTLYAVASRDVERARKFAAEYGVLHAYGSYDELANDDNIDLVYIATPHSHHFEQIKLCIGHGRNVLCEKAFVVNEEQAREVTGLAKSRGVFLAEAIWTRYMPSRKIIDEIISSGIVGTIRTATCNLSYDIDAKERIIRPELAGGALLDIGVYGLNFFVMHLGKNIETIESSVMMTESGVDGQESITLKYANGVMAVSTHSIYVRSDRQGIFHGDKGYIVVENINNPQSVRVYDKQDNLISETIVPKQISGYEYQIEECMRQIAEGRLESESMPLDESIYMMSLMDGLRHKWGMSYE